MSLETTTALVLNLAEFLTIAFALYCAWNRKSAGIVSCFVVFLLVVWMRTDTKQQLERVRGRVVSYEDIPQGMPYRLHFNHMELEPMRLDEQIDGRFYIISDNIVPDSLRCDGMSVVFDQMKDRNEGFVYISMQPADHTKPHCPQWRSRFTKNKPHTLLASSQR